MQRSVVFLVVLGCLVGAGEAGAVTPPINDAVDRYLDHHRWELVEDSCYVPIEGTSYCAVKFNTRHRGCLQTFSFAPFHSASFRRCRMTKWRIPTMPRDDFVNGVDASG